MLDANTSRAIERDNWTAVCLTSEELVKILYSFQPVAYQFLVYCRRIIMIYLLLLFGIILRVPPTLTASTDSLALYFGGEDRVPPMVNNTYGGETELLLLENDSLILNCSANYPVKWINAKSESIKVMQSDSSSQENTNQVKPQYSALIKIDNVSLSDDHTILRCVPEAVDSTKSNSDLSTTICVRVTAQSMIESVYAIRSSMDRIVTTIDTPNVNFTLQLRRQPWFDIDLLQRLYRTFVSPVDGDRGEKVTKIVEYTGSFWSTTMPPYNRYQQRGINASMLNWTSSAKDLNASISLLLKYDVSGNYTFEITDYVGTVYYSKTFELIRIFDLKDTELKVFLLDNNTIPKVTTNYFGNIVQQQKVETFTNTQSNVPYLLVCEFRGNPLFVEKAFMCKGKFDCSPMAVNITNNEPRGYLPPLLPDGQVSSDSSKCDDIPVSYGALQPLPVRVGTDAIILSALVTVSESMQYGCMYNDSVDSQCDLKTFLVSDALNDDAKKGISATVFNPEPDQVIIGDNVTVRCVAARPRYPLVFVELNGKFITYGDDPGHGYEIKPSVQPYSTTLDLLIRNINLNQSGVYTCRGQRSFWNYMSDIDESVLVNVQVPEEPRFGPKTTPGESINAKRSSTKIQLYCDAQGAPIPKVLWRKNGQNQTCVENACDETGVILSNNNRSISIPTSDTSNSGNFRCLIINRLGSKTKNFNVNIFEPATKKPIALIACLAVAALMSLILFGVAVWYYRKCRLTRELKSLLRQLQTQAKEAGVDVKLDEAVPTNQQTDALPFDFRYEVAKENIELTNDLLGSGAFGRVSIGYMKLDDGSQLKVAIKSPLDGMKINQQKGLLSEMKLMMHLGTHVNVLSLLGVMTAQMTRGILCAILEYCEFGSLRDYLQQRNGGYTPHSNEASNSCDSISSDIPVPPGYIKAEICLDKEGVSDMDLLSYCYQIASGISFLSSKNIVHRDLALRNMLLNSQHIVKIADFGLALQTRQAEEITDNEEYLPLKWMAIESITAGEFTKESDVWSYGVVLWEIYNYGAVPYSDFPRVDNRFMNWLKEGNRLKPPSQCPQEIATLMHTCWRENQIDRPTVDQCQETISKTGKTMNSIYWENLLSQLKTMSDDVAESNYYNLNQIISLRRRPASNTGFSQYTKVALVESRDTRLTNRNSVKNNSLVRNLVHDKKI